MTAKSKAKVAPKTETPDVRWMIRRDMPEVIAIENECFPKPWEEEDFLHFLSRTQRCCIGMVAEIEGRVAGFMVYELHENRLQLLTIAVAKELWGRGIGTAMIDKLVGKLNAQRRKRILLEVRETNLPAQLFFRAKGFKAISVLKDFYEDSAEDAYLMQYRLESVD